MRSAVYFSKNKQQVPVSLNIDTYGLNLIYGLFI